jgi:hypothetical protein
MATTIMISIRVKRFLLRIVDTPCVAVCSGGLFVVLHAPAMIPPEHKLCQVLSLVPLL